MVARTYITEATGRTVSFAWRTRLPKGENCGVEAGQRGIGDGAADRLKHGRLVRACVAHLVETEAVHSLG